MRRYRKLAAVALLPLASCGGGGGGGMVAAPTPAASASPTPSPSASPSSARFALEAGSGVAGTLILVVGDDPTASTPSAQFYTDLSGGLVTLGTPTQSPYGSGGGITAGFPFNEYRADYALKAFGYENPTRISRSFSAPRKSTTASPLTELIQLVGDQQSVKNALGLGPVSTFPLPAGLDLTLYSAVQDMAAATPQSRPGQVLAANIRAAALEQAVEVFAAAPGTPSSFGMDFPDARSIDARIAAYIKANPTATLDTAEGVLNFLRSLRSGGAVYRDDALAQAATLLHNFGLATRLIDTNPALGPRYSMAVAAALRPRLDDLAEQNSASAITPVGWNLLQDEASRAFADQLPFPAGKFIPVPDIFRMAAGARLTIFKDNTPGYQIGGTAIAARPNMTTNDVRWNGAPQAALPATIRSIQVAPASAGAIDAVLQTDGSVLVTARPGFTGIAWYDYVAALDSGEVETGRVYLFVR